MMRTLPDDDDDDDRAELAGLNPEPWMVEALALNPVYVHWGPDEDYMAKDGDGWESPVRVETWADFGPWTLDEMNECVHFYYEISRDSVKCRPCDGSGSNPETKRIADDFYDFANRGARWVDRITDDEAAALVERGRGFGATTAAEFNAQNAPGRRGVGHDAINRWILVETRAKRLGVYGNCALCNGAGHIYTAPAAHLSLILWMLHPRKGASRGVEIKSLSRDDVRASAAWLSDAARRNADRFSRVMLAAAGG